MKYTCIKHQGSEYYDCYKGFISYTEGNLHDYKIISIPKRYNFDIIQNIYDFSHLKMKLGNKIKIKF
jgi:hypothetical protein